MVADDVFLSLETDVLPPSAFNSFSIDALNEFHLPSDKMRAGAHECQIRSAPVLVLPRLQRFSITLKRRQRAK
ncbi:hypothetical protein CEY02_21270, partial [Bacillus pumilus]